MEQGFITILKQLIDERGKEALLNTSNCKALLADYTKNEYKKESRLLLNALEAGTQKAIDASTELPMCKKQQIRLLCEDYSLAENMATDVVDTLVFVLRGDGSKMKAEAPPKPVIPQIKQPAPTNTLEQRMALLNQRMALLRDYVIASALRGDVSKLKAGDTTVPVIPQIKQSAPTLVTAASTTGGIQITPTIGSIIPFGGYDWRVLDVKNNKALLLSEKVLEKRMYHSSSGRITWSNCTLRSYLNGAFYNTFRENDKARISETRVTTNNNPWYGTKGGTDTKDRIFLLSIEEVVKYFGDSGQLQNRPKNARGIYDQYNSARIAKYTAGTASWWWLRSPGYIAFRAAYISDDGYLGVEGSCVFYTRGGVRPALWLNL